MLVSPGGALMLLASDLLRSGVACASCPRCRLASCPRSRKVRVVLPASPWSCRLRDLTIADRRSASRSVSVVLERSLSRGSTSASRSASSFGLIQVELAVAELEVSRRVSELEAGVAFVPFFLAVLAALGFCLAR